MVIDCILYAFAYPLFLEHIFRVFKRFFKRLGAYFALQTTERAYTRAYTRF